MKKTVPFTTRAKQADNADSWVGRDGSTKAPRQPQKRLTIDIDADLHRALKMHCVQTDQQIAELVRELITKTVDLPQ